MIPTNSNNITNCDPISSNCVIWQGPDLECVDICTGDTISDVIAALCDQLVNLTTIINNGIEFNIANINQSTLIGITATNLEELIQLIIDNIILNQGGSTSTSSFSCEEVFKCAVTTPECFSPIFISGGTLGEWITAVSQYLCDNSVSMTTQENLTTAIAQRLTNLEQQPKGEPTPRIYSSGVMTKNILTPIDKITQALDSQFIQLRGTTGTASNISNGVNAAPADIATPISDAGYSKTLDTNPITGGDSLYNVWVALDDARRAITDIQTTCCDTVQLQRMGSITTFFTTDPVCATAVTNGTASASGCTDIWNSTGVSFDNTVKAYTNPYNPSSTTELINGNWYVRCATGTPNLMSQYSVVSPYWGEIKTSC